MRASARCVFFLSLKTVSSESSLTNKIEMLLAAYWLSRREAALRLLRSLAMRVSPYGPVHPTIGRSLTISAVAFYRATRSMKSLTDV